MAMTVTTISAEMDTVIAENNGNPMCYSVTVFTQRWKEIRDFYVEILDAKEVIGSGQLPEVVLENLQLAKG